MFETQRLKTRLWSPSDLAIAQQLWGDPEVTRFTDMRDQLTPRDVEIILNNYIKMQQQYQVQYWPLILKHTQQVIGCCGLKPRDIDNHIYELGFHILRQHWGQGYATEAAQGAIDYAFNILEAPKLVAGHNPSNLASRSVIKKLGFTYIGDEFYEPANAMHPLYELINPNI